MVPEEKRGHRVMGVRLSAQVLDVPVVAGQDKGGLLEIQMVEERIEKPLNISEDCHYMGALGAAMFALDEVLTGRIPAGATQEVST